jgi:hypothetical protein
MLYTTEFLSTHFYVRGAQRGVCTTTPHGIRTVVCLVFLPSFLPPPTTSIFPLLLFIFSSHVYCIQVTSFIHIHIPCFPILLLHLFTFSDTHTHTFGKTLWMGIGPSQRQHTTFTTDKASMHPAGFEPEIPASERSQTHALDRAVTVIRLPKALTVTSLFLSFASLLVRW